MQDSIRRNYERGRSAMRTKFARLGAIAALLVTPALIAQTKMPSSTTPIAGTFLIVQANNQWMAPPLVGLAVYGPSNEKIGSISDLIIDQSGSVQAVVISVGGFFGIGSKDVAVVLREMVISRESDGDKATVKLSKSELELAPTFQTYAAAGQFWPSLSLKHHM